MNNFITSFVAMVITVTLSACTGTPTISDHLQLHQLNLSPDYIHTDSQLTRVSGGGLDYGRDVICDVSNTCTLFGDTFKSFGETTDFIAVHLDSSGAVTWARTYGGTHKDTLWRAIKTQDQGYLLIGTSESLFFTGLKVLNPQGQHRPFILKLGMDGRMQWAKTLDIRYGDAGILGATQDADGNYIFVGKLYVNLKLPISRRREEEQWRWIGGNPPRSDREYRRDILVLKLSAEGKPIFMNRYIPNGNLSIASSVTIMPNSHVLIAGQEEIVNPEQKFPMLLEIDASGEPIRAETFKSGMNEYPNFILRQPNGAVILAGTTSRDEEMPKIFSLWLDQNGAVQNARLYSNARGLQVMNATLGHANQLAIAGRTFDYKSNITGMAFTVTDKGAIDKYVALDGKKQLEFDGIWPLAGGGYRLLGDTDGFGASYIDMITSVWASNAKSDFTITESSYTPSIEISKIDFMSGDLKSITNIPVSLVEMTDLKVEEPKN